MNTGTTGVKADHIRYINTFRDVMKPAAKAFYAVFDNNATLRQYIDLVLSWSQSIPYNELTGRGESNGAGFLPPIALLNANMGDCDSKSVLAATLIRSFMPQAKMALIILPKHALLGIGLRPLSEDITYGSETMPLVLMEPTGPAPLTLGQVAPSSMRQIQKGMVTLQSIP